MITLILECILFGYVLIRRLRSDGEIEGQPLGMPKGTVRALITIAVVSFPFHYLLANEPTPSLITNAIFILIAFYFQNRKKGDTKLNRMYDHMKDEQYTQDKDDQFQPLYLPRYTVRCILLALVVSIIIYNEFGPDFTFETTNTMIDILSIIMLFFFGAFLKVIRTRKEKKELEIRMDKLEGEKELDRFQIMQVMIEEDPSWLAQKGKSLLSIITLSAVLFSLILFSIDEDLIIILPFYTFSLRDTLLLLINVYYGYRD